MALLAALAQRPTPRRVSPARWRVAAGGLAVAAAVLLGVWHWAPADTPPYALSNALVARGGYIDPVDPDAPALLRFGERTHIRVDPHARLRVRPETGRDVAMVLEDGRIDLSIDPGAQRQWLVEAGPFRVRVTGTVFDVDWAAEARHLDVALHRGSVEVEGPLLDAPRRLRAGDSLRIDLRDATVSLERPAQEVTAAPDHEQPEAAATPQQRRGPVVVPRSWPEAVADGEPDAVLSAARRIGVGRVLRTRRASDLRALADAARYRNQDPLARRALLALQRRFPRSRPARDATFLLGRIAERTGNRREALRRYRAAARTPGSSFRSEALGRTMLLLDRAGDYVEAEATARTYIEAYPQGPHARHARRLLREDP